MAKSTAVSAGLKTAISSPPSPPCLPRPPPHPYWIRHLNLGDGAGVVALVNLDTGGITRRRTPATGSRPRCQQIGRPCRGRIAAVERVQFARCPLRRPILVAVLAAGLGTRRPLLDESCILVRAGSSAAGSSAAGSSAAGAAPMPMSSVGARGGENREIGGRPRRSRRPSR